MDPLKIYNHLNTAIQQLGMVRERDIFTDNERALLFICYDNMVEIRDLLSGRLPSVSAEAKVSFK